MPNPNGFTFYTDHNAAYDFVRINYDRFLERVVITPLADNKVCVEFKIAEEVLQNKGINFLTPLTPHYTRIDVHRSWILDAAQLNSGYAYFAGQLLGAIDQSVTDGLLAGAAAVPVKIALSEYDGLTGLSGSQKVLQGVLWFYNDKNIPCE